MEKTINNNIKMGFIKKYITWFLVLIIIIQSIIIFKRIFPGNYNNTGYPILKDTNLLIRYEKEIKRDTIIKWCDKLTYKKSEPEKIFIQETDTVFIQKTKELDLMLQIKKENRKLIIKAVNQSGDVLKEYVYEDVGNDFTAISQRNNIFIKSKILQWNGINAILSAHWSMFKDKKISYNFGVETGINYKNKVDINTGLLYSPEYKDLLINSNLKIKF